MFFRRFSLILIVLIIITSTISLSGNPFVGNNENEKTPVVRPPGSSGFMVETQIRFKEKIGEMLKDIKNNPDKGSLLGLFALAFLYGVLHAAGPGHRKTVIFSMFLTRKAHWIEPIYAAFLSASIHAGTALFIILLYNAIAKNLLLVKVTKSSQYLEGITYIILFIITLFFISKIIFRLIKKQPHTHGSSSGKSLYTTLFFTSFFPCPGVIMILTFSLAMDVLTFGIVAVIALSIGMGLTISLVGFLALTGREGLFRALKKKENIMERISVVLELGSFVFLLLFSFWMVYPFILSFVI